MIPGLVLPLLFTGCMRGSFVSTSPAASVAIAASPTSIAPGGSSTLTVTAANATQVTVTGTDGSNYTLPTTGGTQAVSPATTTTYTAAATGTGGNASAKAIVTVTANPAPTVGITANPASISAGSSSTLTVTAANATQVTLTGTDGSTYTLPSTGGTQAVSPAVTTTYTATATGAGGNTSAKATVTVTANPAPAVTIVANPASITAGTSSMLTVTAANATGVKVTGSDGSSYTLPASGGTQAVSPAATTTYTATATGAGGITSAAATVTVTPNPAPTLTMTANPTSILAGASSILTVTATNATHVTITGTDASSYTLTATGGVQAVSPAATTTYTATATGAAGKTTAIATVTVTPNPAPTVTIAATPSSITAGTSSTLTVTAVNSTQVTITGTDGSSYPLAAASGGIQAVSPATTTTYTATAIGPGGTVTATAIVTVIPNPAPTVTIVANPTTIVAGNPSTLTVTATNATAVTVTGTDNSSYPLAPTGGTQAVNPATTATYTATATGAGGTASASTTVTVTAAGSLQSIDHVIFMLQENHSFDNYFGMLNPYRENPNGNGICPNNASGVPQCWNTGDNGVVYNVDGIDDKLTTISNSNDEGTVFPLFKFTSTCIDDVSSAWLESYGDVNTYDFSGNPNSGEPDPLRTILMDGFVHNAEGFANSCNRSGTCSGAFTDTAGERVMGYYDQNTLNYYYYMASQFAVSDRWFSPVASKSISNRIAVFSGGTTQGLVKDPGGDDHLPQLDLPNIFAELDTAKVSWKIYYTVTQGFCLDEDDCTGGSSEYPATDFSDFSYSYQYLYANTNQSTTPCVAPTQGSQVAVGDPSNSFCIDTNHIAPISQYYIDLTNGTLPSFAFIEAGYGNNDEHPGSGQSILAGQAEVAKVVNAFTASPEWADSVFFLSYDEGGGPYDHVPPVPGSSNINTNTTSLGATPPDISAIAVNPDTTAQQPTMYFPCLPPNPPGTPTTHCDLSSGDPGAVSTDAAAEDGFGAQLGFRLPNIVISPFTRRHYVSHTPMDHTAVIKFVENRFIGPSAHLTNRDAAQPDLLEFFDFNNVPWATPPSTPTPMPVGNTCTPASMGP
jgi:phospholipase C